MISEIVIQRPYLLLFLYYYGLLLMILFLKVFLHLAHYLRVLESPLFLHVKLASQFHNLILFDE